jgi:type VI secretion system protein ImpK
MQSAMAERSAASRSQTHLEKDLLGLATPVLEMVMQLRAGRLAPSNELRSTIAGLLRQMEQQGARLGCPDAQIQSAKFALAAFVDETVLAGGFPLREEWERYPLQLEYFKEAFAGTKFFERLDELLKNAEPQADVIEVYYLCLLLGFKGKYHIFLEDQLPGVINQVADHLRRAGRLRSGVLAPHWKVTDQPDLPAEQQTGLPPWVKLGAIAALGLLVLVYVILNLLLTTNLNEVKQQLLK